MNYKTKYSVPAVVVGFEKNGLGVARALHQEGITCLGVAYPEWNPTWKTNACTVIPTESWTEEALVATLLELAQRMKCHMPIIITKDEAVLWISRNRTRLSPYYHLGLPDTDVVERLMSKEQFRLLAEQEGWPIPRTWAVESHTSLENQLSTISFPCILKPQLKNSLFRQRAPRKAFIAHSPSELRRCYNDVAEWEKEVVVQEYIGGGDERIAFCLTYWGNHRTKRTIFSGRKLLQWPPQCGNTALAEPAPQDWADKIEPLTRAIWDRVGFSGIGSIEFKMRPGTDEPVIMEPTVGRTNYQNEVAVVNGVNIPAIAYRDLAGHSSPAFFGGKARVRLVDGPAFLKSGLWHWRKAGDLSLLKWLQYAKGPKRYMLWRRGDVKPFMASCYLGVRSFGSFLRDQLYSAMAKTASYAFVGSFLFRGVRGMTL